MPLLPEPQSVVLDTLMPEPKSTVLLLPSDNAELRRLLSDILTSVELRRNRRLRAGQKASLEHADVVRAVEALELLDRCEIRTGAAVNTWPARVVAKGASVVGALLMFPLV